MISRAYLDHASVAPMPDEAREAMAPWLRGAWNPSAAHAEGRRARALVDAARADLARLWEVRAREILFCASGSESVATALLGVLRADARRRTLVVSRAEHVAVLDAAARAEAAGYEVCRLPVDAGAQPDLACLEARLAEREVGTVVLSCMYVNNEFGTIADIGAIARLARARGALLHCDAIGAGESIDPRPAIAACDATSLAAQKCGGPTGAGVLIARAGFVYDALVPGGPQEYGRRAGTENCAAIAGAAVAFAHVARAHAELAARGARMQARFEAALRAAFSPDELRVAGETRGPRSTCLTHLAFADVDGAALLAALDLAGFSLSAGSACAAGAQTRSHVVDAAGLPARFSGTLRCSWGRATPDDALDAARAAIVATVRAMREGDAERR